jgi:HEAT repeat protein/putative zinc finger protein
MNHERVNLLLDTKSAAELTAAERQAVDQHLASCSECREIWEAYGELAALRIPATPPYLRVRIATALVARASSHARRGLFIGVALLVGAALAATAVLQLTHRSSDSAPEPVPTIEEVAPAVQPAVPPEPPAPSDEPVPSSPEPIEPSAAPDTVTYPLDPYSLVVIGLQRPGVVAETAATLATCYDTVVEQLRAAGGLNVIAGGSLRSVADRPQPEFRVARDLGAGSALTLLASTGPSCFAAVQNVETANWEMVGFAWQPEDWRSFGNEVAASVREWIFNDTATLMAERRAAVLDTARSDYARVDALLRLRLDTAAPAALDQGAVAVGVEIGMTSRDVNARWLAWFALRGVNDPYIVAPLLNSLANDAEDRVRAQAALALATFAEQPLVKDALTSAAAEVPPEPPKGSCCDPTVRSAARLALRAGGEPAEAVRGTVLDESLTPRERLWLWGPDLRSILRLDELGAEAARTVFALGSSADDDEVRARAWHLLGSVNEPGFVAALLEDLARHPAETVRAGAATGLTQHRSNPDVRAALERAQADSSLRVREAVGFALDGIPPP